MSRSDALLLVMYFMGLIVVKAQTMDLSSCYHNKRVTKILYELSLIDDTLRYTAVRCHDYYSKVHSYGVDVKKIYSYNIESSDTSCYHVCRGNYVDSSCTIFCSSKVLRVRIKEKMKKVSLDIEYIEDGWGVYCVDSFVPPVSAIALDSGVKHFFEGVISLANLVAIMGYINHCVYIDSIVDTQIYYHIASCNLNDRDGELQHSYKAFYFKGKVDWLKAYIFSSNDASYEYYNIVYRLLYVNNSVDSLFYNQHHEQKQDIVFVKECDTAQQQNLPPLLEIVKSCNITFSESFAQIRLCSLNKIYVNLY